MNIKPESTRATCLTAGQQLAGRFGWHLLAEEDWAAQAAGICAAATEKDAFQACLNIYSRALYDACRNSRDAPRQAQAYTELHYYLFQKARRLCPDSLVAEAAQTALVLVFEKIATCRDPGKFLFWAWFWLRAATKNLSRPYKREIPLPEKTDADSWDDAAWGEAEFTALSGDSQLVDDLLGCIAEARRQHPRACDQLNALCWKTFDAYSDREIAEILHTSVGHVYVLQIRARKKLRVCLERKGYQGRSPSREV